MRRLIAAVVALALGGATAWAEHAFADAGRADTRATALGPGLVTVDVGIRYSRFSIPTLRVRRGTLVRFLVHNGDPIRHELVVGPPSVHRQHEIGTESTHPPVPGEVSVAPDDVGETFYDFEDVGRVEYACHLPGHLASGMTGWVIVGPDPRS